MRDEARELLGVGGEELLARLGEMEPGQVERVGELVRELHRRSETSGFRRWYPDETTLSKRDIRRTV